MVGRTRDQLAGELHLEHMDQRRGDAEERETVISPTWRYLMAQNPHSTGPQSGLKPSAAGFLSTFLPLHSTSLLMFLGCLGGRPRNPPSADHSPSPCLTQALCSLPFGPQTVLLSVTIPPPMAMELYRVPSSLLATHSGGFSWLTAGHKRRQVREGQ